jgi:predicted metal-dependent phosphoesterase TrpH
MWCDFHLHSDRSDGEFPPARVADIVADAGIGAFALTDHDTTAGHAAARSRARERGVAFVGGIEMTTYGAGQVIHVLGLGVPEDDRGLSARNATAMAVWSENQRRWVQSLADEGFDVSVERDFGDRPVLLPAMVMRLCARGVDGADPRRVHARFREYFAGLPVEAHAALPTPAEAAETIRAAGGVAILAHPARICGDHIAEALVDDVDGIEAVYAAYGEAEREALVALALDRGKLYSCGSDYHGYFNGAYANPRFVAHAALARRLGL